MGDEPVDEQACSSLGQYCYWDSETSECHGAGPCVNEDAFNCFASMPFMTDIGGFPSTYQECSDNSHCDQCAEDFRINGLCDVDNGEMNFPESCGTNPIVCLETVMHACMPASGKIVF